MHVTVQPTRKLILLVNANESTPAFWVTSTLSNALLKVALGCGLGMVTESIVVVIVITGLAGFIIKVGIRPDTLIKPAVKLGLLGEA